jgi:hypothetical protein
MIFKIVVIVKFAGRKKCDIFVPIKTLTGFGTQLELEY